VLEEFMMTYTYLYGPIPARMLIMMLYDYEQDKYMHDHH
jgi:hypothetical protein